MQATFGASEIQYVMSNEPVIYLDCNEDTEELIQKVQEVNQKITVRDLELDDLYHRLAEVEAVVLPLR